MSKFHINKHGVPAPCRAIKGNCPLGGADTHFDSQEQAQNHADKKNSAEFGTLPEMGNEEEVYNGHYGGSYFTMNNKASVNLSERMNESNSKEVFDNGFRAGDIKTTSERFDEDNAPIDFDANISKVGDNEYEIKGQIVEYGYVEKDFDTEEDYEEYRKEGPDTVHEVNYKFTGDEMKDALVKYEKIERGTHPSQTAGIVMSSIYYMTRDKVT